MKKLKPSHREKKRYLLLEETITEEKIEKAILEYVGVLGYAKACPKIVRKSKKGVILAINRKELDNVRASFLFKNIKIKKVSGNLKKLKN